MRRRSVLVLAPEPAVRDALATRLADDRLEVRTCASAAEALLALRGRAFDACLLDVGLLAGRHGVSTLAEARRLRPRALLMVVVEAVDVDEAAAALGRLVDEVLVKPCAVAEIPARIGRLLRSPPLHRAPTCVQLPLFPPEPAPRQPDAR